MIAQGFGFTEDFGRERHSSVCFRPSKILCGFKDQPRARPYGEKSGQEAGPSSYAASAAGTSIAVSGAGLSIAMSRMKRQCAAMPTKTRT
jgi:hypothetical protein